LNLRDHHEGARNASHGRQLNGQDHGRLHPVCRDDHGCEDRGGQRETQGQTEEEGEHRSFGKPVRRLVATDQVRCEAGARDREDDASKQCDDRKASELGRCQCAGKKNATQNVRRRDDDLAYGQGRSATRGLPGDERGTWS